MLCRQSPLARSVRGPCRPPASKAGLSVAPEVGRERPVERRLSSLQGKEVFAVSVSI